MASGRIRVSADFYGGESKRIWVVKGVFPDKLTWILACRLSPSSRPQGQFWAEAQLPQKSWPLATRILPQSQAVTYYVPASCSCSLGLPLRFWHQWFCAIPVSSPLCRSPCVIPWVWLSTWPCVLLTQSCPTLCYPLDCSLPGSSVHGISQARIPEWAAISFSRDWTSISRVSCITGGFFTCRTWGIILVLSI